MDRFDKAILEREVKHFEKLRPSLIVKYPNGGYVVIKDEEILGVWNDRGDALKAGVEKYGNTSFLVRNVIDPDMRISFATPVYIR